MPRPCFGPNLFFGTGPKYFEHRPNIKIQYDEKSFLILAQVFFGLLEGQGIISNHLLHIREILILLIAISYL